MGKRLVAGAVAIGLLLVSAVRAQVPTISWWSLEDVAAVPLTPGCDPAASVNGFGIDSQGRPVVGWNNWCANQAMWGRRDAGVWQMTVFDSQLRYLGGGATQHAERLAISPTGTPYLMFTAVDASTGDNNVYSWLTNLDQNPAGPVVPGGADRREWLEGPQNCDYSNHYLGFAPGASGPNWLTTLDLCNPGASQMWVNGVPIAVAGALGFTTINGADYATGPDGAHHIIRVSSGQVFYSDGTGPGWPIVNPMTGLPIAVNRFADDVQIAVDGNGLIHAVIRGFDSCCDSDPGWTGYTTSADGGQTWSPLETIEPAHAAERFHLALDRNGAPAVVYWLNGSLAYATRASGTWVRSIVAPNYSSSNVGALRARLAFDVDNTATVAFYDPTVARIRLARAQPPINVPVSFDAAQTTVDESAGSVTLNVRLAGPSLAPVSVDYATADVTATAGTNYTASHGTLTFAPGETLKTVAIPILWNEAAHPAVTFTVSLANVVNGVLGSVPTETVTVTPHPVISVTTTSQIGGSGDCSLADAIRSANDRVGYNGCTPGTPGKNLISVPAGVYTMTAIGFQNTSFCCGGDGPFTSGPDALPAIASDIEIRGAGGDQTILIRDAGAPDMRFFEVDSGALALTGLTLRGGRATGQAGTGYKSINTNGGAVLGSLTVNHVTFDTNYASGNGGAIDGVQLDAFDSTFSANTAANGQGGAAHVNVLNATRTTFAGNTAALYGGAAAQCPATYTVVDSQFLNNAAAEGGAIRAVGCGGQAASVTVAGSSFTGNTALNNGNGNGGAIATDGTLSIATSGFMANRADGSAGAISSSAGPVTMTRSTIAGNGAGSIGGGIALTGAAGTLTNVTIVGNHAGDQGGGVSYAASGSPLVLDNVTIAGNDAGNRGGGLWYFSNGADIQLANTIVASNTSGSGNWPDLGSDGHPYTSLGDNLIGNPKDAPYVPASTDLVGSPAVPLDPQLGPLADNGGPAQTRALLAGSPAIDAGSPEAPGSSPVACATTDERGITRPQGTRCDIGAFELEVASTPTLNAPADVNAVATGPSGTAVDYGVVSGTDATDGTLTAACAPQSGSLFPIGTNTVTCTVTNSRGLSASASFTVVVADAPPAFTAPADQTLTATSAAGAAVTYTVPTATDYKDGTDSVSCDPASGSTFAIGASTVTCSATNSSGMTTTHAFMVTVNNAPPTIANPGPQSNQIGGAVRLAIAASDPDGDSLSYSATGLPPGLTMGAATGVIAGVPTLAGTYVATAVVSDGQSAATATFAWTIVRPDLPPVVINPGDQQNYDGDVVALLIVATDPDGDALRFTTPGYSLVDAGQLPPGLQIDSATGLISGTVSGNKVYPVTVTVSDGIDSTTTTFNWNVLPRPRLVTPRDQVNRSADTVQLQLTTRPARTGVAEPGGFSATGLPPGVTISADGLITGTLSAIDVGAWDPTITFTGLEGVTVQTRFHWVVTAQEVTDLEVRLIAPGSVDGVFLPARLEIRNWGHVSVPAVFLTTTVPYGSQPSPAWQCETATVNVGTVQLRRLGAEGADVIQCVANLFSGAIAVNVEPPAHWVDPYQWNNDARVAETADGPKLVNPGDQRSLEGRHVALQIQANDPTAFGIFHADGLPPGLGIDPDTGVISGLLSFDADGSYTVTLTLLPGDGSSTRPLDTVSFTWQIVNVNRPPVVDPIPNQIDPILQAVSLAVHARDPEGRALSYAARGLPPGLAIDSGTGVISGTPAVAGTFAVTVAVSDGVATTRTQFTWRIVANTLPVVTNPGDQRNYPGDIVTLPITAKDPDGDVLRFTAAGLPSGLTIDASTGVISGTIGSFQVSNSMPVTVTVSDRFFAVSVSFTWMLFPRPTLVQPRDQVNQVGDAVQLQIHHRTALTDVAEPGAFSAIGLPASLTISPDGLVSGTLTAADIGAWDPTITFRGLEGVTVQMRFHWVVTATPVTDLVVQLSVRQLPGQFRFTAVIQNWGHTRVNGTKFRSVVRFGTLGVGGGAAPWNCISGSGVVAAGPTFTLPSIAGVYSLPGLEPDGGSSVICSADVDATFTPYLSLAVSVSAFPYWSDPYEWNNDARADFGVPADQPTLVNPQDQQTSGGQPVALQIHATDPNSFAVFQATGLPPGLGIDPDTGLISGLLSGESAGSYTVTVSLTRADRPSSRTLDAVTFTWRVLPPVF